MAETKAICPYCQVALQSFPAHKKKCPSCGQFIFVRTSSTTREKILVREDEAAEIERLKQERFERERIEEGFLKLERFGVTRELFIQRHNQLAQRFDKTVTVNEVIWDFYNELSLEFANNQNASQLNDLYNSMALLADETNHPNALKLLGQSKYWELISYQQNKLTNLLDYCVKIDSCGCEFCESQNGKTYTIEQALQAMPLPHKKCLNITRNGTVGFCRCEYMLISKGSISRSNKPAPVVQPAQKQNKKSGCGAPATAILMLLMVVIYLLVIR